MIYHFINLFTSTFIYLGVYYFKSGDIYLEYLYVLFFPWYLFVSFLFFIYFTPKNYVLKDRTQSALLQFIFTLFSLSLVVSLIDQINISRYFVLSVVGFSVTFSWLIGLYNQDSTNTVQVYDSVSNSFQYSRLF